MVTRESDTTRGLALPTGPLALAAAGLIPFFAGATAAWLLPVRLTELWSSLLVGYGAVILSFVGAVHWGFLLAQGGEHRLWRLSRAVVPALAGWIALYLDPFHALALLVVGLVTVYFWDRELMMAGLAPPWYPMLRRWISLGAVLALLTGMAALRLRPL